MYVGLYEYTFRVIIVSIVHWPIIYVLCMYSSSRKVCVFVFVQRLQITLGERIRVYKTTNVTQRLSENSI